MVGASTVGYGKLVTALGAPAATGIAKLTTSTLGGVAGAYVGSSANSMGEAAINAASGDGFKVDFDPNVDALGNMAGAALGPVGGAVTAKLGGNATTSAVVREATALGATEGVKASMEPKNDKK